MSITWLAAAADPDSFARGLGAAGIVIAVGSLLVAWRAFRRGGYKLTVELDPYFNDFPIGNNKVTRRIGTVITVTNKRMGKVQIVAFHGQADGIESHKIAPGGADMFYTFDGIQQEQWNTYNQEVIPDTTPEPPFNIRIRVGAEVANGKIVWSKWTMAGAGESMLHASDLA